MHTETDWFMRLKDILEIIPISKATWYRGVKSGLFPKPLKLTKQTVVWRRSEIMKLVESIGTPEYQTKLEKE